MFTELPVEGEEVLNDVPRRVGELLDRRRVALHGPARELVAARIGDQPGVGLVPDPQTVLGEQRGGIGVVRRHRGLLDLLAPRVVGAVVARRQQPGLEQVVADPLGELGSRLGRERESEDLPRRHPAGGDQPDHARGHHGGLAGPRAGDHHGRLERRGDRGELLVAEGEVLAHQLAQLLGVSRGDRRHDSTVPAALSGQMLGTCSARSGRRDGRRSPRHGRRGRLHELLLDQEGATLGLLGLLLLHLGQDVADPELHQLGPARRHRPAGHLVGGSVVDGELVEPELGVPLDLGTAGWVLAGLEVDDHHPAVLVELEPVGVAVQADDLPVGEPHLGLDAGLGGQHQSERRGARARP